MTSVVEQLRSQGKGVRNVERSCRVWYATVRRWDLTLISRESLWYDLINSLDFFSGCSLEKKQGGKQEWNQGNQL